MSFDLRQLLPRQVRLRLWCTARIDHSACWLCDHNRERLAVLLWKVCRLW